ncbi:uncharacterized protein LOC126994673 [Eriocheir sinensis]|nr:uncharacterized protein LOC126994673 [Eriocheir sinensis]
MWRRNQDKVVPDTAVAALDHCDPVTFPTIHRLLQILAVLPVSAAEAERTFSKVTRTLTEVRATMGEERLEALVMCQTHRDLLPASEKVVDFFMKSGSGTRRAQLK